MNEASEGVVNIQHGIGLLDSYGQIYKQNNVSWYSQLNFP